MVTNEQQLIDLCNKVRVLDFVMDALTRNHGDFKDKIEIQYKEASAHKLKLTEEILRHTGCKTVEELGLASPTSTPV